VAETNLEKGLLDFRVLDQVIAPEVLNEISVSRARAAPGHFSDVEEAGAAGVVISTMWGLQRRGSRNGDASAEAR